MFISLGHTHCHPAHAYTHTPVSSMDTGFQASRWLALTVTQKRTCEILISVKPQATIFASINTFSLVPSPEWQGRVKIFHSLKRALQVYSSKLGRASRGFPVTGWTTRGASTLGQVFSGRRGLSPTDACRVAACRPARSDAQARPVFWTWEGDPLPGHWQRPWGLRCRILGDAKGIWEGPPDAPPLSSTLPRGTGCVSPRLSPDLGVCADCTSSQGMKSHPWLAHPWP